MFKSQKWGTEIEHRRFGEVASPLYPHYYLNNRETEWSVYAGYQSFVYYEILDFDIVCNDKLKLTDGEYNSGNRLFDACGDVLDKNPGMAFGETKNDLLHIRFEALVKNF